VTQDLIDDLSAAAWLLSLQRDGTRQNLGSLLLTMRLPSVTTSLAKRRFDTSNSRSRQMRSDSGAKSQLSRLAFRKPAMLAVA